MYFNVITLLVQRVTKLISLYYNDNKVSIYLSIYLSIYHRGGGAESFAFFLVSFSFKQPVSTVRVLLSRFKSSQVSFIVNSSTCTVHTYRELKLRYSQTLGAYS